MHLSSILTYSFAIFAMFFGSGNLVFPLEIGLFGGGQWVAGFVGLFLTGILLPFLGLFVIKLNQGNVYRFFNGAGPIAGSILPFFILSLLGSFGVVPRCITVAHGGLVNVLPDFSLIAFSSLFCLITFLFCLKEQMMVSILGKWMSPILLLFLFLTLIVGFLKAPADLPDTSVIKSLQNGFFTGYQTMDLFAAFFFSAFIFRQMQSSMPTNATENQILRMAIVPSIISSFLLALVYLGLVFLGSHYGTLINNVEPELMLPTIVTDLMGGYASVVIAALMILSCLTTAVALNNIYAQYLTTTMKIPTRYFPLVVAITTGISWLVSLLDFQGIARFLKPALDLSYPGLIVLTLVSIFFPKLNKEKLYLFWGTTIITGLFRFIL